MLQYEKKYWQSGKKYLAGIDEAGRGPLAGPVAAAAVILPQNVDLPEVTDSKKISEKKRERLFDEIYKTALSIGVGVVHEEVIDKKIYFKRLIRPCAIHWGSYQSAPK